MHRTRLIIPLLCLAVLCIAAGSGALRHFYGSSLTVLHTGHVFVSTNNPVSFWVGDANSNAVKVGDASWSNNVTASVTNGLASTQYVAAAIGPLVNTNDPRTVTLGNITASNLVLSAVRWTDTPMKFTSPWTGIAAPTRTAISWLPGQSTMAFDVSDEADAEAQLGHNITTKSNSSLYVEYHGHLLPTSVPATNANLVTFRLVYSAGRLNDFVYGPRTSTVTVALSSNTHTYVDFEQLNFTNHTPSISTIYWGTFTRIAAPSNSYPNRVGFNADVHYPVDRLGSAEETSP